ncbi:DUF1961 family protein [bacterium]|nr:DUF1961 family protein [bacterium]
MIFFKDKGWIRRFPSIPGKAACFSTALSILFLFCCSRKETEKPRLELPGYKAKLLLKETFQEDLSKWKILGPGTAEILPGGILQATVPPGQDGMSLWLSKPVKGSFLLEFDIGFKDTLSVHSLLLCAGGRKGEDLLSFANPDSTGKIEYFTRGPVANYQIRYHAYDSTGAALKRSRIYKNPGRMLLSHADEDPCLENRNYFIEVMKIANRIQVRVDGNLIHDVRDKGGFGPILIQGMIGFWISGASQPVSMRLRHVRLFELSMHSP